jgi:NAD(P)-dependent dehydrogenase (short-subunit alcohol dehydrogenase family)
MLGATHEGEDTMGRLDGKVALITGGASGMGMVASKIFAGEGASVVLTDVTDDAGEAVAADIEAGGGRAHYVHADVSDEADAEAMVKAAADRFGGLHVLYNNAGVMMSQDGSVTKTDASIWDTTLDINVKGVVLSMTREIAVEYARRGIRCNALCPGPIDTPLLAELLADPARRQRRFVHIPMGRLGQAEELAKAALFLASDDSSFMTGASLIVDGGITAAYVTPEG